MGYDRIAYFEGTDAQTTLICGDKESARVVYGHSLSMYLGRLGFKTQVVIDRQDVAEVARHANRIDAEIKDLPERTKVEIIPGHRLSGYKFLEVSPPLDDDMTRVVSSYFETHCEPSDSGLILDYRAETATPRVIGGY